MLDFGQDDLKGIIIFSHLGQDESCVILYILVEEISVKGSYIGQSEYYVQVLLLARAMFSMLDLS